MSDLLVGSCIALLPFWCLDAKGGEVVLFRICFGLGVSRGICFELYLCGWSFGQTTILL
jgi:hypothetical protein